ncbi:MFS transporter [Pectobacterium sp. 1950-15]|uniref:MFS transporter n=1 Tax=Pectobacterium sp. 1950-15 TaxID=3128982 RepID=UPI003015CC22
MKASNKAIYIGIMTSCMLDSVAVGILLPVIPLLAIEMGANAVIISALVSIQFICGALGSPILGRISDHMPRGVLLLISLIAIALCYWGLAFTSSLLMLFVLRAVIGFMSTNLVILESIISQLTNNKERSAGIARLRLGSTAGLILGPGLAGLLGHFHIMQGLHELLVLSACMSSLVPLVIAWTLRGQLTTNLTAARPKNPYRNVLKLFFANANIRDFALIKALIAVCFSLLMTIAPLWAVHAVGWTTTELSMLVAVFGLSLFFIQVAIATNRARWLTSNLSLFLACLVVVPGFVMLIIAPSGLALFLCCVGLGLSSAVVNIVVPSTISKMAFFDVGAVLGMVSTTVLVASTVGPLVFGAVYQAWGGRLTWACGLLCALVACWLAMKYVGKSSEIDEPLPGRELP